MASEDLACLLANCLPNTLDTTVSFDNSTAETFIITGDIRAMWLRDATNQVLPYIRWAGEEVSLQRMLAGLVRKQAQLVLADPFANAHYQIGSGVVSPNTGDDTSSPSDLCKTSHGNCSYAGARKSGMTPGIYERKYELDSLMAFLKLSRMLHEATSSAVKPPPNARAWAAKAQAEDTLDPFDMQWLGAVKRVLDVIEDEQKSSAVDSAGPCGPAYSFKRSDISGQGPLDTLLNGVGSPAARTGMIRSAFRPSDDACTYGFLVPANAMAVVELRRTEALISALCPDGRWAGFDSCVEVAIRCETIAAEIDAGIAKYGIVNRPGLGGDVFAYEVDGFGNANLMDDANVPSLLSLPWLGYLSPSDPTYVRTRAYVLSNETNPWYFSGSAGEGVGGPHTGPQTIWPMAIMMRALTSTDDAEIASAVQTLKDTAVAPGSWLMHESFHANDATMFTRPWFAMANSLFGELLLQLSRERPHLLGIKRA